MKYFILSLLTLLLSVETYAQHRGPRGPVGPRYNPPGPGRYNPPPMPPRYDDRRPGPVVVVRPRYVPRPGRVIRSYRRPPIVWDYGFGYTCGGYRGDDLLLNGRLIHSFRYSGDCYQALSDIRLYGDFCDNEDLYDQSGILEAQFTFNYECRDALGYYY